MKRWFLGLLVVWGGATAAAFAADPAGEKAIHDYTLTMPMVRAWAQAMDAFEEAAAKSPALAAEADQPGNDANATLAQTVASFDHHPELYAFFRARAACNKKRPGSADAAQHPGMRAASPPAPQLAQKVASKRSRPRRLRFCKANLLELRANSRPAWSSPGSSSRPLIRPAVA